MGDANAVLPFRGWPSNSRMLAIAAAMGFGGALMLWVYRCRNQCDSKSARIFREAERKKACGVEAFRQTKFEDAIRYFGDAIGELRKVSENADQVEEAKMEGLLSSCENNNAACYDALGNTEQCLIHCDLALKIKPDYVKAMVRRAKCHFKLGQNDKALSDYLDLICMENIGQENMTIYQAELDRVADAIIVPLHNELIQSRVGKPMKISQVAVSEWMYGTVTNDPLLARMSKLANSTKGDKNRRGATLDEALLSLTLGKYDDIAALTVPIVDDDANDFVDRMLAVLLAARFLNYQTLKGQAMEIAQRFDNFWNKLDEAQKLAHKDVHVAYITLQLTLIDLVENESSTSGENVDEAVKQRCHQLVEEGLRINPKNVDPLITFGVRLIHHEQHHDALGIFQKAKKLDQKNPFVFYYETHVRLSLGIRQQSFIEIQQHMFFLQKILTESDRVPIFAFIILSKFAMLLQNNQMALEACKKVLEKMPNCAYAIYLIGLLDVSNRSDFSQYVQSMERAMRRAIEADPNYWEPYRIMAKIYVDKKSAAEAVDFYSDAISLAQKREELMMLLKEQLMINTFMKRKEQGKSLPHGMMLK